MEMPRLFLSFWILFVISREWPMRIKLSSITVTSSTAEVTLLAQALS
jgi:hypothetical protein